MVISIASGKGGTGKTTIATNLALSLSSTKGESPLKRPVQILDCDVEEPNSHIFIKPVMQDKIPVFIPVPQVDMATCNLCGKCKDVCAHNAIAVLDNRVLIFPELCHGCGACSYLCPQHAMGEVGRGIGFIEIGESNNLQFIHGKLNIDEAMSPPLIRTVKQYINPARTVILDAPPGTSCPVITAIKDTDFCILVTEPTPFGLSDLILAVDVLRILNIPFGVVINRSDVGNEEIDKYCKEQNIPILMRILFKKEIAYAYAKGIPIIKAFPEYRRQFQELFYTIMQQIKYYPALLHEG